MTNQRIPLIVALSLVMVAAILALVRRGQSIIELEPAEFGMTELNNLTWDSTSGFFTVTGPDPFGHIVLPDGCIPLHELRLEFEGPPQPGGWYVYPTPAHLPVITINQDWVVTGVVDEGINGHAIVWSLNPSKGVRLDFPDELLIPFKLQRAVFTTRFASSASPVFVWMSASAGAAILILLWLGLGSSLHFKPVELLVMVLLIAFKLWIAGDFGQMLYTDAMHDDKLFMDQGASILAGNWLGDYWQLTLAKGPTYSVFIALAAWSGLSLQFNEVLLHALACAVFVLAISPWLRPAKWRVLLFFVLVFEPHSMSAELIGRVLRGAIQPALTLLTLAGLIGMITRTQRRPILVLPWSLLAGLAGGAFWFSREEGIWLAPTALLLLGTALVGGWKTHAGARARWVVVLLFPLVVFQGLKIGLRTINHHHYGMAIGVDVSEGGFPAAYGAMLRVAEADPIPGVPITSATRKLIYPESPAFAEMADKLEGKLTKTWARSGWDASDPHPRANLEIRGGWYQWAIRQGASELGYYENPAKADAYWQRVADEINTAVDDGRLAGGRKRSGFFPVWHHDYNAPLARAFLSALDLLVRFTDFKPDSFPSIGSSDDIDHYAQFLNARPVLEREHPRLDTHIRIIFHRAIAPLGWPLTAVALVATGWILRRSWKQPSDRMRAGVLLSLWGGAVALSLVCALVHVTSFYAVIGAYLGPAVPMVLSCWVLAPVWAWSKQSEISS